MRRGPALAVLLWVCVAAVANLLIVMPWVEATTGLNFPDANTLGGTLTPILLAAVGAGATRAYEKRNGGGS